MTKSTFYAIFKADEFGNFEAHIKEVTYSGKEKGENIIVQKKIKIDKWYISNLQVFYKIA